MHCMHDKTPQYFALVVGAWRRGVTVTRLGRRIGYRGPTGWPTSDFFRGVGPTRKSNDQ